MTTQRHSYSCEFFPPRTDEGRASWRAALKELSELSPTPAYFSCTYGAGGTTQSGTRETLSEIIASGHAAAAHITCIGSTEEKLRELLADYQSLGVKRLVALRGDLPDGMSDPGIFHHADELVRFIRAETGDYFHIEVAAYPEKHPQASSLAADIDAFVNKARAGADSAITQYFFDKDAYFRFVDAVRAKGCSIPIIPGIMPITNYKQLARFSEACGAIIPTSLADRFESFGDDLTAIRAYGLEVVQTLCEGLLAGGAPGLHFYTLNRAEPSATLWRNLALEP